MKHIRRCCLAVVAIAALALFVPTLSSAATGPAEQVGAWSQVTPWPLQAKHMVLLNTGKVLTWGSEVNSPPYLWDPATDPSGAHMRLIPIPDDLAGLHDLHCAGQVTLADGRVLVVGGQNVNTHVGIPLTAIFDPVTETWSRGHDMHFARWYPTATLMADGRVLVTSGDHKETDPATGVTTTTRIDTPEIYDPSTDTWTDAAKPINVPYMYPFMYQLPSGSVFEAGTRFQTQLFDPSSNTWTEGKLAPFNTDAYSESGAMYLPGKIVRAGGGDPAKAQTAVIDASGSNPAAAQWRLTAPMHTPRRRMNLPIMADGNLLAVGGTTSANLDSGAVYPSEIWNASTEQWTEVAPIAIPRMYHSTALTLPDGTVVSAGGETTQAGADEDNPTSTVLERSAQVYSPPYLFHGTRPAIASAPAQAGYGGTLSIGMTTTDAIAKLVLMRPSAVTHAIDMSQRYVPLDFTQNGSAINASAPSSPYRALPGYYMLVAVNAAGVPSVAKWVLLGTGQVVQSPGTAKPCTAAAAVAPRASITAMTSTAIPVGGSVQFASNWGGPPTSFAWNFGDGAKGSGAAQTTRRFLTAGTYNVTLTVKNSLGTATSNTITVTVLDGPVTANSGVAGPDLPAPGQSACGAGAPAPATPSHGDGVPASTTVPDGQVGITNQVGGASQTPTTLVKGRQTFRPVAEASVASRAGSASPSTLQIRHGSGAAALNRRAFLKFDVSGLGGAPASAILRLHVTDPSADGGSVFAAATGWPATAPSWKTAPATTGTSLASAGATAKGGWVSLDVTDAVRGNGPVSLGLLSTSDDTAGYTRTGGDQPVLVVTPAATADSAPAAELSASPRRGTGSLTVAFANRSTGATSWAWDFQGDGKVDSTQRAPKFTYTKPGTYTVKLTARNAHGSDVATQQDLIVVGKAGSAAATKRFSPTADASISSTSPRAHSAGAKSLAVRQGTTAKPLTNRSYVKFAISGLKGAPTAAKLRLYVTGAGSDGGSVFAVGNGWTERGLSWSNAPGVNSASLASAGPTAAGTWIELDVTRAIAGNGQISFALATTGSDAASYASREDRAHRPQIVITAGKGAGARQAVLRRAHLASLLSPKLSLLCPLLHDEL